MGGRCAEEIFVSDISSGAQQDIEQATNLARSMVCEWGMSDKLGAVAYDERDRGGQYLGMMNYHEKRYSEETARAIDAEVRSLLDAARDRALQIIKDNHNHVELMTQMLMEFETLDREDILKIYNDEWDIEEKRVRLQKEAEEHRKKPVTPPPPPKSAQSQSPIGKPPPPKPELQSDMGA